MKSASVKKDVCLQIGDEDQSSSNEADSYCNKREWQFTEPMEFSDLQLKVADQKLHCHKIMLATRSPVFRVMLSSDFIEKSAHIIEIKDIDPESVEAMLQAIYTPAYRCSSEKEAVLLLPAVDRYQVAHVIRQVEDTLLERLTARPDMLCLNYLRLARRHNLSRLVQSCLEVAGRASNASLIQEIHQDPELGEYENMLLKNRIKTLEEMIKNIELCLNNPCSRIEKKEVRVPVNFCPDHASPFQLNEEGHFCTECVKRFKAHIKNVCTTDKIRTTINFTTAAAAAAAAAASSTHAANSGAGISPPPVVAATTTAAVGPSSASAPTTTTTISSHPSPSSS